jgi:hypothetical protein
VSPLCRFSTVVATSLRTRKRRSERKRASRSQHRRRTQPRGAGSSTAQQRQ